MINLAEHRKHHQEVHLFLTTREDRLMVEADQGLSWLGSTAEWTLQTWLYRDMTVNGTLETLKHN